MTKDPTPKSRSTVMVVEDEMIVGFDIIHALQDAGWDAIGPFKTTNEALEALEHTRPDLVTLDVMLRNGELVTPVAERAQALGVPILVISAHRFDHVPPKVAAAATRSLWKPVVMSDVLRSISEMLSGPDPSPGPNSFQPAAE